MMRRLHRWISIIAAVFLLNVAITGSLLAVDELKDRVFGISPGGPGAQTGPRPQAPEVIAPSADLGAMINKVYAAAFAADPDDAITLIRLQLQNGEPEGLVQYNGESPNQLVFNSTTGALAKYGPPGKPPWVPQVLPARPGQPAVDDGSRSYHQLLKHWHRGDFLGWDGRWMDIATGFSLLFLSLSALKIYADLLLSRRALRRKGLFWR